MIGIVCNTDYGWMVKENGPFGTHLPLHPDTDKTFMSEGITIEYNETIFGVSNVALVNKRIYTNEDSEIIALDGKLQGLRGYMENLLKIRENPTYKGDLTEEIERLNVEIKETESKKNKIKNGNV